MCAICGFATNDFGRTPGRETLLAMRETMEARGPDDCGDRIEAGVGLGSRRLAILDLSSRGRMPMSSADGRYWIVHNGEIYNYRELREPLAARGYQFRSDSDTEVLLAAFIDEGPAMLERLNGMFAFAIWDEQERTLFLARDRLGVKPLHWAIQDGIFFFASEPKALFAAGLPRVMDPASWSELLLFRYVAGPSTPFLGIHRLLPGTCIVWRNGAVQIRTWWDLSERIRMRREGRQATEGEYSLLLENAVSKRLISDVAVGVLLSGGLDSATIAALAAATQRRPLGAFTCRFAEAAYDEGPLAGMVAARHGLVFHERFVRPEALLERLEAATWYRDEPLAHASDLHMMAVAELAKTHATVLLSGEGADETLGGYERYRPLRMASLLPILGPILRLLPGRLTARPRVRKLQRILAQGGPEAYLAFNAAEILPDELERVGLAAPTSWEYRSSVSAEARALYKDALRQAMFIDQKTFLVSLLDRNDRMTMAASIECRVPFLDYRLVELAGALPTRRLFWRGRGKGVIRRAMRGRLPEAVLWGRKWGFGVPWAKYFRTEAALRAVVEGLADRRAIQDGPLDRDKVRGVTRAFSKGDDTSALLIQALIMIATWYDICVKGSLRQPEFKAADSLRPSTGHAGA
jgi:asparagine synthase (glutamine-hydrolysing)